MGGRLRIHSTAVAAISDPASKRAVFRPNGGCSGGWLDKLHLRRINGIWELIALYCPTEYIGFDRAGYSIVKYLCAISVLALVACHSATPWNSPVSLDALMTKMLTFDLSPLRECGHVADSLRIRLQDDSTTVTYPL